MKSVFQDDSVAIDATDTARKATSESVLKEKATRIRAAKVLAALRTFLISTKGAEAVAMLGDFGLEPPKPRGRKSVASKAVAVAKAKATRAARGTKGPVQKQDTVGTVEAGAIKSAINEPTDSPIAKANPPGPATHAVPAPVPMPPVPAAAAKAGGSPQ